MGSRKSPVRGMPTLKSTYPHEVGREQRAHAVRLQARDPGKLAWDKGRAVGPAGVECVLLND